MSACRTGVDLVPGEHPTIRLRGDLSDADAPLIERAFAHVCHHGECRCVRLDAAELAPPPNGCLAALACGIQTLEDRGIAVKLTPQSRWLGALLEQHGGHERPEAPSPDTRRRGLELDMPCAPESVAPVRAEISAFLSAAGVSAEQLDDIVIAVGEAAGNAARHGCRPEGRNRMHIYCRLVKDTVEIDVRDPGCGFDLMGVREPDLSAAPECGMGIFLMRQLMDEVTFYFGQRGTAVHLRKRLS